MTSVSSSSSSSTSSSGTSTSPSMKVPIPPMSNAAAIAGSSASASTSHHYPHSSSPSPTPTPESSTATFENTSILETFGGRNIFITGCTGFVGKVLLEKILRCIPSVGTIYLLIRPRKGSTAVERFHSEIISSECFTRLRNQIGISAFQSLIEQKCRPVVGELTQINCGISADVLTELYSNVHIILHCAAVVDFNERLDRAIELNVLGTLRMLDLAKRCACINVLH
jgi:FlaA1/EpsC-like NDP-sugar epimerase